MAMVIITQKPEIATQYGLRRGAKAPPPSLEGVSGEVARFILFGRILPALQNWPIKFYREFLVLPTANDDIPSHLQGVSSHLNRRFPAVLLDWQSKEGLVR